MKLVTRQVAAGVPIYDLVMDGVDVGCLTVFPGEGPMATVRCNADIATVTRATMHECLIAADHAYQGLEAAAQVMPDEGYIEDEDGDLAFQRMMECRYENGVNWDDEPMPF